MTANHISRFELLVGKRLSIVALALQRHLEASEVVEHHHLTLGESFDDMVLLCDPLNNSINEKLSRIRQAFRAVAHDSVANCYVIQGERGEKRSITLSDEYIELGAWGK